MPTNAKPWLILMLKAPVSGQVKTRLAADIGDEAALRIYRAMVERIARTVLGAGGGDWQPVVAFTPDSAGDDIRRWLAPMVREGTLYLPQGAGDLGARLTSVFERCFDAGASAVLAIGADCIDIAPGEIRSCIDSLSASNLVVGPAEDGGYWIVGMRGRHFGIFENMPWSSPELIGATRRRAGELRLELAEAPTKSDIDTRRDLDRLAPALRAEIGPIST